MTQERWRCFVAVPVPAPTRAALVPAIDLWRARPDLDGLRWVPEERWHLTLAFLGTIPPASVPRVAAAMDRAALAVSAPRCEAAGLGAFPSARAARVAWVQVADQTSKLARAATVILANLDVADAPLRAHITIGRARSRPIDLRAWIADRAADVPRIAFMVDTVELIRSHMGAKPRYETLHRVALTGSADA